MALTAKEAAGKAIEYLNEFLIRAWNIQVEEVEMSENGNSWLITVGFELATPTQIGERQYKTFEVDIASGSVKAMRIRQL